MKNNVHNIRTSYKDNVKKLLKDCESQEFDGIVVFGLKNRDLHIVSSEMKDIVELLGMLEITKSHILANSE